MSAPQQREKAGFACMLCCLALVLAATVSLAQGTPPLRHVGAVCSLAFSPDGSTLASGGMDGTIILWDVATWTATLRLTPSASARSTEKRVERLLYSPSGQLLVSVSYADVDNERVVVTTVWDARTQTEMRRVPNESALTFSPDGTTLAVAQSGGRVALLETATWKCKLLLEGFPGRVCGAAYAPDGRDLLTVDGNQLAAWNPADGAMRGSCDGKFHSVTFSHGGTRFVTCESRLEWYAGYASNNYIALWDRDGRGRNENMVRCAGMAASSDGVYLVAFQDYAQPLLLDGSDLRVVRPIKWNTDHGTIWKGAASFSPDRETLAIGAHTGILICNVATGAVSRQLPSDKWVDQTQYR